ncbi:cytochrome c3 family protein [soil metagenome]
MTFRPRDFLVLLLFVAAVAGCHKSDEKKTAATGPAEAASPEHYVTDEARVAPKPARAVAFVAVAAAPKPTEPLPRDTSCVTAACHSRYETAPHIHGPVAAKACNACHQDDIGEHRYPLKRDLTATCTFCHAVAGTQTHQHKALEKGCVACHRPHESEAKFLLKSDTVERVCATCHEEPMKKFAHDPFAKGDCTLCHQPHQSDNAKLLRGGSGVDHCFSCHSGMKEKLAKEDHHHEPVQKDCTICHSPHATDFKRQLKAEVDQTCLTQCHKPIADHMANSPVQHAAMVTADGCVNCHDPHGSTQVKLLKARMDVVCLTCHNKAIKAKDGREIPDMKPAVADAKFLHGPIRVGNCSACHDAHGGQRLALLKGEFPRTFYTSFAVEKYGLCFSCHEKQLVETEKTVALTGFRDGDRNLHFLHVNRDDKGRSCKTCHNVHGSDLPKHIATDVPFEGSAWAMPMGYQKTGDGGSCTPGCHKTREYSRSRPTTLPTTRGAP